MTDEAVSAAIFERDSPLAAAAAAAPAAEEAISDLAPVAFTAAAAAAAASDALEEKDTLPQTWPYALFNDDNIKNGDKVNTATKYIAMIMSFIRLRMK